MPDREAGTTTWAEVGHTGRPNRAVRQAGLGVAVTFFLTGLLSATWAARLPAIKEQVGLSDGQLAIAFLGLEAGAIIGLQLGGLLVPRRGSRPALRLALPAFAAAIPAIALAPNLLLLAVALFVTAVANGVVDVAMNTHGVAVERYSARPLLSRLHAMHPLGGIIGGVIAALLARLAVAPLLHFAAIGVIAAGVAVAATAALLPATADADPSPPSDHGVSGGLAGWLRGWSGPGLAFGALAFCITLADGAALNWGAVYLRDDLGADPSLAAAGITTFLVGITLGRLAGDRVILRVGPAVAFRSGALLASGGFGVALLMGAPAAGVAGLGLLGLGLSYLLPLLFSAASRLPGEHSAASIVARVSTLGYLGSFVGPALIGPLAGTVGLAAALAVPAALVASAAVAVGWVLPRKR